MDFKELQKYSSRAFKNVRLIFLEDVRCSVSRLDLQTTAILNSLRHAQKAHLRIKTGINIFASLI